MDSFKILSGKKLCKIMMEIAFRDLERASRNGLNMEKDQNLSITSKKGHKIPQIPSAN